MFLSHLSHKISQHLNSQLLLQVSYTLLSEFPDTRISLCLGGFGIPGFYIFYNSALFIFVGSFQKSVSNFIQWYSHLLWFTMISFSSPFPASLHSFQYWHLNHKHAVPLSVSWYSKCKPSRSLQSPLGKGRSKVPGWTGCQMGSELTPESTGCPCSVPKGSLFSRKLNGLGGS